MSPVVGFLLALALGWSALVLLSWSAAERRPVARFGLGALAVLCMLVTVAVTLRSAP